MRSLGADHVVNTRGGDGEPVALGSLIGAPFCGTLMAEFGADVIKVEDPDVGDMSRHLDYATLSKDHPRLVMAHVSGFGQTGPYRDRLAFDRIATAFSGQDFITAMFCTIGVLVALHHRDQVSGRGQEIDLALYEGILRLAGSIEAYDLPTSCA